MTAENNAITLPEAEAGYVLRAREVEESASSGLDEAKRRRATRMAAQKAGPKADFAAIVSQRAHVILQMAGTENSKTRTTPVKILPGALWTLLLCAGSLALGFAAEHLTSEANRINLLAMPFYGIIAWNLLVYVLSLVKAAAVKKPSDILGIRTLFTRLAAKPLLWSVAGGARFFSDNARLYSAYSARAFHFAAVAFVLGMCASLALRGVGTSFSVGWESTWFENSPDIVSKILESVFWVSVPFCGPLPDASDVLLMRFDRLSLHGANIPAAVWLARMGIALTAYVIIPRLILGLLASLSLSKKKLSVVITTESPYYEDIANTWMAQSVRLEILVDMTEDAQSLKGLVRLAQSAGFDTSEVRTHAWDTQSEPVIIPFEKTAGRQEVWVLTNALHTPEDEVLGSALAALKDYAGKNPVLLFADTVLLEARFSHLPEKIASRKELYERFAVGAGVRLFFYQGEPFDAKLIQTLCQTFSKRSD